MKRFIGLILFITISLAQASDFVKVGTTAGQFLKVEPGARAIAMGASFAAVANDATALYWNPAGIAHTDKVQGTFTHTRWIADIYNGFAGVAVPIGANSAVGASIQYQTMDKMEQTTIEMPRGTGIEFGAEDLALGLTYAVQVTNYLKFGITGKYIYQKLWNESATGLGVDMGLLLDTGISGLEFAMVMTNFGTDMKMDGRDLIRGYDQNEESIMNPDTEARLSTESWPLPTNLRISLAADILGPKDAFLNFTDGRLTTVVDLSHPNDSKEQYNIGMEYAYHEMLFARAGYRGNTFEEGLTLGAGLNINVGNSLELLLDYAYADFGIFNSVQHFTVGFRF